MSSSPEALFEAYLASLGIELDADPELASTAQRFSDLLRARFDPRTPIPALEALPTDSSSDDLVIVRSMSFRSLCAHHIAPFFGVVSIAFVPDGKLVGFGAFNRLVDAIARRPQIQERLVATIADEVERQLAPRGLVVACRARQMCMEFSGTEAGAETIATAARGTLAGSEGRALALEILR
jgi:GTP cyclohydrolase I